MTHSKARLLLVGILLAFLCPTLLRDRVVFPHDNSQEVGLPPEQEGEGLVSNRKFGDQSQLYVPILHHHLNGNGDGWISTWNPGPELGRPTDQISGLSKAFFLTHAFSWFTSDALRLYTWLAFAALFLSALFGYLLFEALDLRPEACFVGALGVGVGVFVTYWLTFAMFLWAIAWTLATLWATTLFLRERTFVRGLAVAFFVHCLLATGYPQEIVWHGYFSVGYVALLLLRLPEGARERLVSLGWLGAAVVIGALSVAPIYLDLALNAGRSARLGADVGFFLAVLPDIRSWQDVLLFAAQLFDAFWPGNPIEPTYPFRFNGTSLTPFYAVLAAASLAPPILRRVWPVHLFVGVAFLCTLWPPAYAFGVHYAKLDISRYSPQAAAWIPLHVLAAFTVDAALRSSIGSTGRRIAVTALGLVPAGLAFWCVAAAAQAADSGAVWMAAAFAAGAVLLFWVPRGSLALVLAAAAVFAYGWRVQLVRPIDTVHRSSPLVELVETQTAGRERFAWVAAGLGRSIPANQEAFLGLRSIHSYNSLSSRAYQDWVLRLSEQGTLTYGRHFPNVSGPERLGSDELSWSGVGLLLAGRRVPETIAEPLLDSRGKPITNVYRTTRRPLLEAVLPAFTREADGANVPGRLHHAQRLPVRRELDLDDRKLFRLRPAKVETLLFVSQQFHPQWLAYGPGGELETILVNGFYQGVVVPPGTERVELRFLPLVRWAWVPQVFFALAWLAAGYRALTKKRRGVSAA